MVANKLLEIFEDKALIQKIAQGMQIDSIIVGAGAHCQESAKYFAMLGPRVFDLTGKTSLVELAALLKKCALLVSNDSGPVHLAACVGTPVVAIFRNDSPGKGSRRWGPWGKGGSVIEKKSLLEISVEEVLSKIKEHEAVWNTH